ncbi:MAG: TonB-dependent receptor [Pelagibaca sp.]|nr:TonB-dependent receptor [Pelagibaca sp.]
MPPHVLLTRRALAGGTALTLLSAQLAHAQDEVYDLGTITITAGGFEQLVENAPGSVTVIDRQDLEGRQIRNLEDALVGVQGVVTTGVAKEKDISIRGLPGEYTLILVDGVRQGTRESRPNGSAGYEQSFIPPVSAIERIEVVRGPMSSLYGSDAMGGVVNIITRPVADEWTGEVSTAVTIPQDDDDGASKELSFYLSGPVVSDKLGLQVWGRGYGADESGIVDGADGARDRYLNGRLSWAIAPGHTLFLEGGTTELDRTRTDGESVEEGRGDSRQRNTRDHLNLRYSGDWSGTQADLALSREWGERNTWSEDDDGSMSKSDRTPEIRNTTFDAKFTTPLQAAGEHTLVYGGQWTENALTDQNPGRADPGDETFSVEQWAVFAEDEWWITPSFALTGGLRYTEHESYGGEWTPRLYAVWNATDALTIKGGVSTGFKAPGVRQTVDGYYYTTQRGAGVIVSNPDLQPEKSTSYELGAIYTAATWDVGATLFRTEFEDKIASFNSGETVEVDGTTYNRWEYTNIGEARIQGLELSGSWAPRDDLSLRATYTWTDSEQLSGEYEGLPLMRTPEHTASLRADWQTPVSGLDLWGAANYHGREINAGARIGSNGTPYEYDDDGDAIAYEYDPYTTVDIGGSYVFNDAISLDAAIYNVTDVRLTSSDNNAVAEGRRFWIGATARF